MKKIKQFLPNNLFEILILFCFISFFAMRDMLFLSYISQALLVIFTITHLKKHETNQKYLAVNLLFLIFSSCSIFWASSTDNAVKFIREIAQIFIICFCLSNYCSQAVLVKKSIYLLCVSIIVSVFYLLLKTPFSEWQQIYLSSSNISTDLGRLGYSIGFHPNSMGYLFAIGIFLFLYVATTHNKKIIPFSMILILSFLVLFTKSRGSILIAIFISLLFLLLKNKTKTKFLKITIITISVLPLIFWSLFYFKPLYNLIGFRFEGALGLIDQSSNIDASIIGRSNMTRIGLDIISKHPLLGVGAGNYANSAYRTYHLWGETYAHNNYIELASDLGIIGLFIYYCPKIFILHSLIKRRKSHKDHENLYALFISFYIGYFIFDYSKITYSSEIAQIMLTLGLSLLYSDNKTETKR